MNKVWLIIVMASLIASCAPSYQKYNRKRYRVESKKQNLIYIANKNQFRNVNTKQHSTFDSPKTPIQSDVSLFVMALYNSWDSIDVETQNFFNECLIKQPNKNQTFQMIEQQQNEDAKIISGWPEEKKKWFAENFFYKDFYFRNDTLFVIK